jgi:twitching motility protein PilT
MAEDKNEMDRLFRAMIKFDASDLHLKAGIPPTLRIGGSPRSLESKPLTAQEVKALIYAILDERQKRAVERSGDLDFSYSIPGEGRYRVSVFRQRSSLSLAARRVQTHIPSFAELHLPPMIENLCDIHQGLIIVSGVTGCGKSTTQAAMLDKINQSRRCHIITIEDPIEYLHQDKKAFISQREVGMDVESFPEALRRVVRQDPDVILIGEMRDQESVVAGLQAADTGHLVLGTLHTSTAPQALGRLLKFFDQTREDEIRQALIFNLKAIICQMLVPSSAEGVDRVPAVEIMLMTPIVRELIQERRDTKLADAIRAGTQEGLQDLNQSLCQLVNDGLVERSVALEYSFNTEELGMLLKGIRIKETGVLKRSYEGPSIAY